MDIGALEGLGSVKHQGRKLKNTYFFTGTALMVVSISLAVFISLGHVFMQTSDLKTTRKESDVDFTSINKEAPIPLLTNSQKTLNDPVKVLGTEVTKSSTVNIANSPPATLLREAYIRSFTFVRAGDTSGISTIYASWNSRKASSTQLYIINGANGSGYSNTDRELYSVEGKGLEVSSFTFEVDSDIKNLYLNIYALDEDGTYILKDSSLIVESSR